MTNGMTHEEFCRRGGVVKSLAKRTAAARNLAKAQEAKKAKKAELVRTGSLKP